MYIITSFLQWYWLYFLDSSPDDPPKNLCTLLDSETPQLFFLPAQFYYNEKITSPEQNLSNGTCIEDCGVCTFLPFSQALALLDTSTIKCSGSSCQHRYNGLQEVFYSFANLYFTFPKGLLPMHTKQQFHLCFFQSPPTMKSRKNICFFFI